MSSAAAMAVVVVILAVVLVALAALLGQMSFARITPLAVASLAYQSVIVAFVSYLSWFWLLTTSRQVGIVEVSIGTPWSRSRNDDQVPSWKNPRSHTFASAPSGSKSA